MEIIEREREQFISSGPELLSRDPYQWTLPKEPIIWTAKPCVPWTITTAQIMQYSFMFEQFYLYASIRYHLSNFWYGVTWASEV